MSTDKPACVLPIFHYLKKIGERLKRDATPGAAHGSNYQNGSDEQTGRTLSRDGRETCSTRASRLPL